MNPNNEVKPPKTPLIFYYCIAMLVLILLNALVMPSIYKASISEVSYSEFLDHNQEPPFFQIPQQLKILHE